MAANAIPLMTDPRGRHWRQPGRDEILVDGTHAVMDRRTFQQLAEYSTSTPTGVYPGKMWKAEGMEGHWPQMRPTGKWFLRWYGLVDGRPDLCSNNWREIILVEES